MRRSITLTFTVLQAPPNSPVAVGRKLSLTKAAELLEVNPTHIEWRCSLGALFLDFQGFIFWIARDEGLEPDPGM